MKRISIQQFCVYHDVPESFIDALSDYDLVEIIEEDNDRYIDEEKMRMVEKLMRLHYDLNINFEGLDVIVHLLNRIDQLENEIIELNNRLDFYR